MNKTKTLNSLKDQTGDFHLDPKQIMVIIMLIKNCFFLGGEGGTAVGGIHHITKIDGPVTPSVPVSIS